MSTFTRSLPLQALAAGLLTISSSPLAQVREIPRLAIPQIQVAPGGGATIYCTFTRDQQGAIIGDHPAPGQPNSIPVSELSVGTAKPLDAHGMASGAPQLQPLTIVKSVDRASPKFFQSVVASWKLSAVDCSFYRQPGGQAAQRYFGVRLENARVVDAQITAGSDGHPGAKEVLTIWYETITLEDLVGGATAQASRRND
jgi:type VI secretion system Hcp family effector